MRAVVVVGSEDDITEVGSAPVPPEASVGIDSSS